MKAEEIRNMEAGREMDALVAEKVMGWERHGNEADGLWIVPPVGDERRYWCAEWDARGIPDWMPYYSTDIAAAWEVVEKMHGNGRWVRIRSCMDEPLKVLGWACDMGKWWNRTGLGEWAETAPLAICRAALLAVMGEGE